MNQYLVIVLNNNSKEIYYVEAENQYIANYLVNNKISFGYISKTIKL